MTPRKLSAALLIVGAFACHRATAQDRPAAEKSASDAAVSQNKHPSDRMFGVVPAYSVIDAEHAPPMTSRQKMLLALRVTFGPISFVTVGAKAGFNQAIDFPEGYGQGGSGYGKRFAAAFADNASSKMLRTGVFPILFHQDPRYFREGRGSTAGRLGYALSRTFVTRTDAGQRAFNWSRVLGSFGSAGLSNLYYPSENRGVQITLVNFGYSLAGEASANLLKEFWPDIQRKLHRGK